MDVTHKSARKWIDSLSLRVQQALFAAAALSSFIRSFLSDIFIYCGLKSCSVSTPSFDLGRSRTWPFEAITVYPLPRVFLIVFIFEGDSTIISLDISFLRFQFLISSYLPPGSERISPSISSSVSADKISPGTKEVLFISSG